MKVIVKKYVYVNNPVTIVPINAFTCPAYALFNSLGKYKYIPWRETCLTTNASVDKLVRRKETLRFSLVKTGLLNDMTDLSVDHVYSNSYQSFPIAYI